MDCFCLIDETVLIRGSGSRIGAGVLLPLYCEGTLLGGGIRIEMRVGQCAGRSSVIRPSVPISSVTSGVYSFWKARGTAG